MYKQQRIPLSASEVEWRVEEGWIKVRLLVEKKLEAEQKFAFCGEESEKHQHMEIAWHLAHADLV